MNPSNLQQHQTVAFDEAALIDSNDRPCHMLAGSTFAHIDALASSALSRDAMKGYETYKQALLAGDPDEQSAVSTLSILVWDLFEGRSFHPRS